MFLITESWLKRHKKAAFTIPGFNMYCVDRTDKRAGGVCIYVNQNLATTVVNEYTSENVSALWIALHRDEQQLTIYASIYHPPNLNKAICDQTIHYITNAVSKLVCQYKNARFLIYGDFNNLDTTPLTDMFPLTQLVWFPIWSLQIYPVLCVTHIKHARQNRLLVAVITARYELHHLLSKDQSILC